MKEELESWSGCKRSTPLHRYTAAKGDVRIRMTIRREGTTKFELPTRRAAIWFQARVWGHVLRRAIHDACGHAVRRHGVVDELRDAPVIAERRAALWRDGRDDEFPLIAGKVHNLRLARWAFDGVVVPAGSILSFWRQLGVKCQHVVAERREA